MHRSIFKILALGTATVFPLTGLLWATPSNASRYRHEFNAREFHQCANELLTTGVVEEQTQVACAMALEPTDLSGCVVKIDGFTIIEEDEALFSCFRVRRPLELAECVVDINEELLEPKSATALASSTLNHCRRSLLPLRFSACVRGLSRENYPTAFEPSEALATCIDAEDFPREIYTPNTNSTDGRGV
ncbi:MAG: hypothetical protein F6J87_19020 [Spirulina sp. SIO3F2]|nr:hypothetical protein [Spirulina sp. SIO3F2]